jgi:hypothetical protein
MTDTHPLTKAAGIAAGTSAAVLAGLAIKYHNRAIFDEHNPNTSYRQGYPLVGGLPYLIKNKSTIHDLVAFSFERSDVMTL